MKAIAIIPLLAISLASCAGLAEAQRREDEARCVQEGFRARTDAFRLCLVTIEEARAKRSARQHQEFLKQNEESRKADEERRKAEEDRRRAEEDRRRAEEDRRRLDEDMKRWRCSSTLSSAPPGTSCF